MRNAHYALILMLTLAAACGGKKDDKSKAPPKPADGTPLSFQFVKMDGQGKEMSAKLKVYNHTDKAVRGAQLRLHYVDAAGKELKTFPWGAMKSPHLVDKNGSATIKAGAFMPPETKSVKVTVRRVEFTDKTKWKASDAAPAPKRATPTPAPAKAPTPGPAAKDGE